MIPKHALFALCFAAAAVHAQAADDQQQKPSPYPYMATMTDSTPLLLSPKLGDRPAFGCNVPKGSRVEVQGAEKSDIANIEALRVKVLNGPCSGSTGYIGAAHLQLAEQ